MQADSYGRYSAGQLRQLANVECRWLRALTGHGESATLL
jgi:uncharacterized phage-associated protein